MDTDQRPNQRLRLQRQLRGWSQEEVAAGLHRLAASKGEPELGVDATMVSRWERGMRRPRPRYVRLLCRLFELSPEQLGIVEDLDPPRCRGRSDVLEDANVERRDFIHQVTALIGGAVSPLPQAGPGSSEAWERLTRALRQPWQVDHQAVDHLERITVELQRLGPSQVSSQAIMGPVVGHLDAITGLLQRSLPDALRARLCSLAGETAGFAGWLRWGADDTSGAAAYFATGLAAAREGGDHALAAYLAGSAACRPPYREEPKRRLEQLDAIQQEDATPASRVWLAAKAADAYALMGDREGCMRALDRAETALEAVTGDGAPPPRPRFNVIDRAWLDGERGASLAKLGSTAEARTALERVVGGLGPECERDRLWLCTALVSTYVQDGEPEQACRVAIPAVDRATRMQLTPVLRIMRDLGRQLEPFGPSPDIQELDERLRLAMPAGAAT